MNETDRTEPTEVYAVPLGVTRLADHWGLVLGYGLVTLVMGVVLLVWPSASATVIAVLLAIQLIVAGIFRIVSALAMSKLDGGIRALVGLSGGIALIVGLLVLRSPLQTVVILGIVLGVWWVISGIIDIISAILSPGSPRRTTDLVVGGLSVVAGGFLLVYTDISLHVMAVFIAIWLILAGLLAVAAAFALRSTRNATKV